MMRACNRDLAGSEIANVMANPLTCPLCRAAFEYDAPPSMQFVDCPACRARVPVLRLELPEEEILVGEVVEDVIIGEVVEDIAVGEVVEDDGQRPVAQPAARPKAVPPPLPPSVPVPAVEMLRPWDYMVSCKARSGLASMLHYEISDAETEQVLGDAVEQSSAGQQFFKTLFGLRAHLAGSLMVTDAATDEPVLAIERGRITGTFFTKPCTINLYGPHDRLLAWFKAGTPMFGGLGTNWNADCLVCDAQDNELFNLEGTKYTRPDYRIRRHDGKVLARVKAGGKWKAFFRSGFAWTDHDGWLDVAINDRAVTDPTTKLILLGTIIAYESIIANLPPPRPVSTGT
jgi:hypothetical protein